MNIAIIGHGKMGRAIEELAIERKHAIGVIIDNDNDWAERGSTLRDCDVAIDFSMPNTAVSNIRRCIALGVPTVVGTTGWYDQLDAVVAECHSHGGALFVASNFSIGMNIMFELNRRLAQMMQGHDEYRAGITETHHIHKLDAPSGTAITLANEMNEVCGTTKMHIEDIVSIREGEIPGIHEVTYDSDIDTITLKHSAKSRKGLAIGALLAAEYLVGKKGYFTMHDLLGA